MADYNNQTAELVAEISEVDRKFRRACKQVVILNSQITDLKLRYDRAASNQQRKWRCAIRLRLATIEGARNMFYEYASRKCEELEELNERLMECSDVDTDSESEMEYWRRPLVNITILALVRAKKSSRKRNQQSLSHCP